MTGDRPRFSLRERSSTNGAIVVVSTEKNKVNMQSTQIFNNVYEEDEPLPRTTKKGNLSEIEIENKKLEEKLNLEKMRNSLLKSRISQINFDPSEDPHVSTKFLNISSDLDDFVTSPLVKQNLGEKFLLRISQKIDEQIDEKIEQIDQKLMTKNTEKTDFLIEGDEIINLIDTIEKKSLKVFEIPNENNKKPTKIVEDDPLHQLQDKIKKLEKLLDEERKEKHQAVVSLQQNTHKFEVSSMKFQKQIEILNFDIENINFSYSEKIKQQSEYLQSIIDTTREEYNLVFSRCTDLENKANREELLKKDLIELNKSLQLNVKQFEKNLE